MKRIRTTLAVASFVLLIAILYLTAAALYGFSALHGSIPTHFDSAGKPNAWGPAGSLWILPAAAVFVACLMTLVMRFPQAFNYPVRVTTSNRAHLQSIALSMIFWLRFEIVGLFAVIQQRVIASAQQGTNELPSWLVPASLVLVFGTIALHVIAMFREAPLSAARRVAASKEDVDC